MTIIFLSRTVLENPPQTLAFELDFDPHNTDYQYAAVKPGDNTFVPLALPTAVVPRSPEDFVRGQNPPEVSLEQIRCAPGYSYDQLWACGQDINTIRFVVS